MESWRCAFVTYFCTVVCVGWCISAHKCNCSLNLNFFLKQEVSRSPVVGYDFESSPINEHHPDGGFMVFDRVVCETVFCSRYVRAHSDIHEQTARCVCYWEKKEKDCCVFSQLPHVFSTGIRNLKEKTREGHADQSQFTFIDATAPACRHLSSFTMIWCCFFEMTLKTLHFIWLTVVFLPLYRPAGELLMF